MAKPTRLYANNQLFSNLFIEGSVVGSEINVVMTGATSTNTSNNFVLLVQTQSDNFNLANGPLPSPWTTHPSAAFSGKPATIAASSVLNDNQASDLCMYYNSGTWANDYYVMAQVVNAVNTNGGGGVTARIVASANRSWMNLWVNGSLGTNAATITLQEWKSNVHTNLLTLSNVTFFANDYIGLIARGTTYSAWRLPIAPNNPPVYLGSVVSANVANSGFPGFYIQGNNGTYPNNMFVLDNWAAGNITNTSLPLLMRMNPANTQIINMVETGTQSKLRVYANGTVAVNTFSEI